MLDNPFEDTLANSDLIPTTKKLDVVVIEDNYINKSTHQENLSKRKRKNKNLSIHQFDDATQQTIQDAVNKQREQMDMPVPVVENHISQ